MTSESHLSQNDTRKAIISPAFGGGWSTWCHHGREAEDMQLFDAELIADAEANGGVCTQAAIHRFSKRYAERFGEEPFIPGQPLVVVEVDGLFRVHEYDGSESIVYARDEQEDYR